MDKNISEIALLFSVKESTIKNRLYRTLRELRKIWIRRIDTE